MKKHLLKYLIAFNFVILAMPFFQTCSDKEIIVQISQENLAKNNHEEISNKKREEAIVAAKDEYTVNGYQLFCGIILKIPGDSIDLIDILILLIPLINILHLITSIKNYSLIILILGLTSFVLSATALTLTLINCDDINQVKFGMHLLAINTLLVCLVSIKTFLIARFQRNPTQVY